MLRIIEVDQRHHLDSHFAQRITAAEFGQVDDSGGADHFGAELLDEAYGGAQRPAGRNQVVDQHDPIFSADVVLVDLKRVRAVFQAVFPAHGLARQHSLLADQRELTFRSARHWGSEQKSAAFDGGDHVASVAEAVVEHLHGVQQSMRVEQQRSDVSEHDSRLREVRNRGDVLFDVHRVLSPSFSGLPVLCERWRPCSARTGGRRTGC